MPIRSASGIPFIYTGAVDVRPVVQTLNPNFEDTQKEFHPVGNSETEMVFTGVARNILRLNGYWDSETIGQIRAQLDNLEAITIMYSDDISIGATVHVLSEVINMASTREIPPGDWVRAGLDFNVNGGVFDGFTIMPFDAAFETLPDNSHMLTLLGDVLDRNAQGSGNWSMNIACKNVSLRGYGGFNVGIVSSSSPDGVFTTPANAPSYVTEQGGPVSLERRWTGLVDQYIRFRAEFVDPPSVLGEQPNVDGMVVSLHRE